jgi:ribulose-bisphosphate carboxylase small chain
MRLTQGTFSFLPDFTDEQIAAQIRYSLANGWAMGVEYTDDPHPRNSYWDMWAPPMFDLTEDEVDVVAREVRACREAFPNHYIKLIAYDARRGRQTTALSFIVNRPANEPGLHLRRTEDHDRVQRYSVHSYATESPVGRRYQESGAGAGVNGAPGANGSGEGS